MNFKYYWLWVWNNLIIMIGHVFDQIDRLNRPDAFPSTNRDEWTVIAAFIMTREETTSVLSIAYQDTCYSWCHISIRSGLKCLPPSKLNGLDSYLLHDSHAEILARRGLQRSIQKHSYSLFGIIGCFTQTWNNSTKQANPIYSTSKIPKSNLFQEPNSTCTHPTHHVHHFPLPLQIHLC